jgi:hypothetical protein
MTQVHLKRGFPPCLCDPKTLRLAPRGLPATAMAIDRDR